MDGSIGVLDQYARADHIHPVSRFIIDSFNELETLIATLQPQLNGSGYVKQSETSQTYVTQIPIADVNGMDELIATLQPQLNGTGYIKQAGISTSYVTQIPTSELTHDYMKISTMSASDLKLLDIDDPRALLSEYIRTCYKEICIDATIDDTFLGTYPTELYGSTIRGILKITRVNIANTSVAQELNIVSMNGYTPINKLYYRNIASSAGVRTPWVQVIHEVYIFNQC
jgi:hypothetical protein